MGNWGKSPLLVILLSAILLFQTVTFGTYSYAQLDSGFEIPAWIRNNADWWSQGLISDREFASGLAYLVQEDIIQVENVEVGPEGTIVIDENLSIPKWIHNNARWWADGAITDDDFKSGIQYMLKENIIQISKSEKPEDSRPNIIVIMTDDLDVRTTDIMLENNLMPNLQEYVINRGTEFKNSFVTTTMCCPSRATLLTGQYAHNHGVFTNLDMLELDDNHTLATWLQNAEYRTSLIGKYLNRYGTKTEPTYVPPGWDSWHALTDPTATNMYSYTVNNNGLLVTYGDSPQDYQTDVLATLAAGFIDESDSIDDKIPFFLLITPSAPHNDKVSQACFVSEQEIKSIQGPVRYAGTAHGIQFIFSPAFNESNFSDKSWFSTLYTDKDIECIKKNYQNRIESMQAVDDLIGAVVEALVHNKEFDNTVIIFTSDNGYLLGEHRRVGKAFWYEETVRVPLFISAPGYDGLLSSSLLAINNDWAPTIIEFAGAAADISIDGRSLVPLLSNPNEEDWRDKFYINRWFRTVTSDKVEYRTSYESIRTSSYVYIEINPEKHLPFNEFYDLETDPYQLENQINCTSAACKEKINELQKLLFDLKDCGQGTCQLLENKQ